MTPDPDRRSFLAWAIFGLGAIFSVILGAPLVCFFLDPRNRKAPQSTFKVVDGVKLDELAQPTQGIVCDTRMDGWTLYPNAVIGRVWVVPFDPLPAFASAEEVNRFNQKSIAEKEKFIVVLSTACPHLGCSVNRADAGDGFSCPCHAATFAATGAQIAGPAQRGMDSLVWEIDAGDVPAFNRIKVEFKKFAASTAAKTPVS